MGKEKKTNTPKKTVRKKKPSKFVTRAIQYKMLPKMYLRGYAAPGGSMMFTDGVAPAKHYSVDKITQDLEDEKFESELDRRPQMGLSMECGTVETSIHARSRLPNINDLADQDTTKDSQLSTDIDLRGMKQAYEKTGIPAAQRSLISEEGAKVRKAISYLNAAVERSRTLSDTKKHLRTINAHYGNKSTACARMKGYARLADWAARVYGGAIAEMDLTAHFAYPKKWAKRVPEAKKQHAFIQKWILNPGNEKLFIGGLAEAFHARCSAQDQKAQQQGDDSDGDGSEDEEDKEKEEEEDDDDDEDEDEETVQQDEESDDNADDESSAKSNDSDDKSKQEGSEKEGTNDDASGMDSSAPSQRRDGAKKKKKKKKKKGAKEEDEKKRKKPKKEDRQKTGSNSGSAVAYDAWPLAEFRTFEDEALTQILEKDVVLIEISTWQKVISRIPECLRKHHFPIDMKGYACTALQARKMQVEIYELVKNVRLAWVAHAAQKLPPNSQITINQQLLQGGLLRQLCKADNLVEDAKNVHEVIDDVENSEGPTSKQVFQEVQTKILQKLIDSEQATRFYDDALDFAKKFAEKAPENKEMEHFLAPLDNEMREALGIPAVAAFSGDRRPRGWLQHMCTAFTLAYACFIAWVPP